MFHLARSAAQAEFSIDRVTAVCFSIFWALLELSLKDARDALRGPTSQAIASAFQRLKAALRKIFVHPHRYAALSQAIGHASEDIQRKLVSISEWFSRTDTNPGNQSFSLEQALDISVEVALFSYKPFEPRIQCHVSGNRNVHSTALIVLSDLVLTMLGNVKQHAHLSNQPSIDVALAMDDRDIMTLRMESDIGAEAASAEAKARIGGIRQAIQDGTYISGVPGEGNTGLMKLASTALAGPDGAIAFDFVGTTRFFVEVRFKCPGQITVPAAVPVTV